MKIPLHLAIGMFDGVHLGHQAVIRQAVWASESDRGSIAGVLTFDPHPSRILRPASATPLLVPLDQRIRKMLSIGIERVFVQPFTLGYASREAGDFVHALKTYFPRLRSIHVGENFRFGSGRKGDVNTLSESGFETGIDVGILDRETHSGEPISSSAIRTAISEGNISLANSMLGYPYTIEGTIIAGKKIGRGLGYPTVNIPWHPEALPRFGVYAVKIRNSSGEFLRGIANYGLRPTVDEAESPLLEVHVLEGEAIPTTGDTIQVSLLDFIRPEKKFSSQEALQKQIGSDIEALRQKLFDSGRMTSGNS